MGPLAITLISIGATLLVLFLIYLYLIMPSLSRRKEMMKFAEHRYAHRGLHGEGAAENSLTAFRRAVDMGYGIELDVRLSRDGEVVVFHDATLMRVAGVEGRVEEYAYSELKEMSLLGTEDKIPLFKDVLDLVGGRVPLLIELKEEPGRKGVAEKTLELLLDYKGAYIVESFNPLTLGTVKKKKPEVLRGMLAMNYMKEKKHRKPLYFFLQNFIFNVVCRPDFLSYDHEGARDFGFSFCKAVFRPVTVAWTVRSEEEEKAAREHGFDTVIFENYCPEEKSDEV